MYHGIIKDKFRVVNVIKSEGLLSISVLLDEETTEDLVIGASVSVDGVCLTATEIDENKVSFDIISETLDKTTLYKLKENDFVNIERSAKANDEVGGHKISGHVDTTAKVLNIERPSNNYIISLQVENKKLFPYIFNKGFLSVNGASLTVNNWDFNNGSFQINLIPETLRRTNFSELNPGDYVNIEIDRNSQIIVDTVVKLFQPLLANTDENNNDIGIAERIASLLSSDKD